MKMRESQSLTEKIEKVLNEVLPSSPALAMSGSELVRKIMEYYPEENPGSLKNYLSRLSKVQTSILAKKVGGQGYYKKSISDLPLEILSEKEANEVSEKIKGRERQGEEKFRAIFKKYYESEDFYPYIVEHTKGKGTGRREKGIDKWKFPDVVLLEWKMFMFDGEKGTLSNTMLNIVTSLGEQPFKLLSVELKVALSASNYREYFFQCVSNSKWSHEPILAIASDIESESLLEEVLRLGKAYGVTIITFGLDEDFIKGLPDADKILHMSPEDFQLNISDKIKLKTIISGTERMGLDWDFVQDLKKPFEGLFEWISYCLQHKNFFKYEEYMQVIEQMNKARERTQRR